jgi:hypothetical protein
VIAWQSKEVMKKIYAQIYTIKGGGLSRSLKLSYYKLASEVSPSCPSAFPPPSPCTAKVGVTTLFNWLITWHTSLFPQGALPLAYFPNPHLA